MRDTRMIRNGKWRWLLPIVLLLALGFNIFVVYAFATDVISKTHRSGLFMIVFAFLFTPSDLGLLAFDTLGARWRVLSTRIALVDAGLRLFFFISGLGLGIAMLFDRFGNLSVAIEGLFLVLGMFTAILGLVTLMTSGKLSNATGR